MTATRHVLLAVALATLVVPEAGAEAQSHASPRIALSAACVSHRTVTLEGMIVRLVFRDPQSWVYVIESGKEAHQGTWVLEWRSARALAAEHIDAQSLAAGDRVIISGKPVCTLRSQRLRLRSIERPSDGWMWVAASKSQSTQ